MMFNPYQYTVIDEVNRIMQWQSEKLLQLEKEIAVLREQVQTLLQSNKQHIEKIEYNFEQLKVENLNGTLIIGISPNDAGKIDEMWIKNKLSEDVTIGQQPADPVKQEIQNEVHRYIRDDIAPMLPDKANTNNVELSSDHMKSIIEDMIRQADERIAFYISQTNGSGGKEIRTDVVHKLKDDLLQAVDRYVEYFGGEAAQ